MQRYNCTIDLTVNSNLMIRWTMDGFTIESTTSWQCCTRLKHPPFLSELLLPDTLSTSSTTALWFTTASSLILCLFVQFSASFLFNLSCEKLSELYRGLLRHLDFRFRRIAGRFTIHILRIMSEIPYHNKFTVSRSLRLPDQVYWSSVTNVWDDLTHCAT
jgi:hypothetical protein